MLRKIISGGQNGADQAGLRVAKEFQVETGGWIPAAWRTLDGPRPDLGTDYGLICHSSDGYVPRTLANARDSDATVRLAYDFGSKGEICTLNGIKKHKKKYFDIDLSNPPPPEEMANWLCENNISVLNVAGNSESTFAGCGQKAEEYLRSVLQIMEQRNELAGKVKAMKKLVIMRGLPWCGKSTRAKEIAGEEGLIFSTDEYWYKILKPEKPDVYSFNPRFLEDAHNWNRLRAENAMWNEKPLVIIDNTNTTAKEPLPYVVAGLAADYEIVIQEPTCPRWLEIRELLLDKRTNRDELKNWARNLEEGSAETHGVPAFAIERMMWRWDNDLTVAQILAEDKNNGST